jgi:beta-glucosidase
MFTAPASPATGSYQIKIFVANQTSAQLFVDGLQTAQRRINIGAYPFTTAITATTSWATLGETSKSHDPNFQYAQQAAFTVNLNAGQQLHLDLRVLVGSANPGQVQLRWVPTTNQSDSIAAATTAAATANKVLDFVYDEGTEGSDRGGNAIANGLATPGYQDAVANAFVGANPNTIVVLTTGDSVFMPWASSVNSILEMWYPGSRGAEATADVLLGNVNPGGKLPETFYDGNAPIGQRFPQDTQLAACENNTANYGTSGGSVSSATT